MEVDEDTIEIHGDNWRWRLSIKVVECSFCGSRLG